MKDVLKTLAESGLIPLVLLAAASGKDAAIHKKTFGSGPPSDLALTNNNINNFK